MTSAIAPGAITRTRMAAPNRASTRARAAMRKRVGLKAAGIVSRRGTPTPLGPASCSGESWRALLHEGPYALHEVGRTRQLVLELGLQVELLVHVRVDRLVQRLLGRRVGARGPGGEALDHCLGRGQQLVVGVDGVDEAPVERLLGVDPLAQQRHL